MSNQEMHDKLSEALETMRIGHVHSARLMLESLQEKLANELTPPTPQPDMAA